VVSSQPVFRIEPLGQQDRAAFSCGIPALDQYLKLQAGQDSRKHVAAVFLLLSQDDRIAGFYTLSSCVLKGDDLPQRLLKKLRLPRYPQPPATLIGRLSVDLSFRGQGLGELLLIDALKRAATASSEVASLGVVVDAKNDTARGFYIRYGFLPFLEAPNRLFLPMGTIEALP